MTRLLVIAAHPALEQSRVNRALIATAQALPAPQRPQIHDLYARYPDFLIDVAAERAAVAAAEVLVWQFPFHWYGMPPLLKLWQDEVLGLGWAYGPGGQALRGKALWLVVSAGGREDSYQPGGHNRYPMEAFWPPYEQTAVLTGMQFLPPLVLFGADQVSEGQLAGHCQRFAETIRAWEVSA